MKLARVRLSLTFLITQTDSFEIHGSFNQKTQFNFSSLQVIDDFAKFNKMNLLSFMSGHIKKKALTWRDKFITSAGANKWKDRFLILSNFGLFEFSLKELDKPKHVYSLTRAVLTFDE